MPEFVVTLLAIPATFLIAYMLDREERNPTSRRPRPSLYKSDIEIRKGTTYF